MTEYESQDLTVSIDERIAVMTLDRPPVNALRAQTFREIAEIFRSFAHRRDVHAAILTAAGERAFCGGVDLNDSARRHGGELGEGDTPVDLLDAGRVPRECFEAVLDCAVPVIGAINGAAAGAGVALAASCDVLVASTSARFGLPEVNAGVAGGGRHLQRLVGPQKARVMAFTGEFVSAEEFHRIGAVEALVEPAVLLDRARDLASRIAAKSPIGVRLIKESLNRAEDMGLREGYRTEQDYTNRLSRFDDSKEARRSVLEKRSGDFRWR